MTDPHYVFCNQQEIPCENGGCLSSVGLVSRRNVQGQTTLKKQRNTE